ncbi:hypothetical protein [Streptomyces sp. NPDC058045]|uniref:hypothetical protein n=1 Tax=Streptomyces sp. NPDC058045 TaxID=3346311 RepID=UPI0036ED77C1
MQQPVVPELAHTTPRPIHWVATAAALAAVLAASSFLQPDSATAQAHDVHARTAPTTAAAPDAEAATYPIECGGAKTLVQHSATGDLDGDHRPETVAVVRCDAGSGTPPDGVYVLTAPAGGKPRTVATLIDPKDRFTVTELAIRQGSVNATLLGYSSPDVPSCCPDQKQDTNWRWQNGAFQRSEGNQARGV